MLNGPGLSATPADKDSDANEIPIEARGADLELCLDFITKRDVPKTTTWGQYDRLLKLFDFLGSDIVVERIVSRLYDVVGEAPWAVFCFASRIDDVKLAKAALAVMQQDPAFSPRSPTLVAFPLAQASGCSLPYFLGLVRATVQTTSPHNPMAFGQMPQYFAPAK